jgi:hypothetical protein
VIAPLASRELSHTSGPETGEEKRTRIKTPFLNMVAERQLYGSEL